MSADPAEVAFMIVTSYLAIFLFLRTIYEGSPFAREADLWGTLLVRTRSGFLSPEKNSKMFKEKKTILINQSWFNYPCRKDILIQRLSDAKPIKDLSILDDRMGITPWCWKHQKLMPSGFLLSCPSTTNPTLPQDRYIELVLSNYKES